MDPQERKLLDKTYKLVKENHAMIRKVRGHQKREAILKFIKFVIIIGLGVGALYYLQPYIDRVQQLIGQLNSIVTDLGGILPN
jgi:hypothetical protein